jgi:hypothetical protein
VNAGPVRLLLARRDAPAQVFKSENSNPKSENNNQTQISQILADPLIEAEFFANVHLSLREICEICV